jgi:outer membrane receptor protein involved in Fe transport
MKLRILASSSAIGLALLSTNVAAQTTREPTATPAPATPVAVDEQQDPGTLGDIVVTSRKQSENLQNTPATIDVIGAPALRTANITQAYQLSGIVAGLSQAPGLGNVTATSFRGIGSNGQLYGTESSVAQFLDGVYLSHARDFVMPIYDLDRIEFIKGTQGTLLGKNTSVGAISYVTRRPGRTYGFELSYTHTFDVDGNRIDGALDLPFTDTFRARVSGIYSKESGYYRNLNTGDQTPDVRDISGRIKLEWDATPALNFQLTYQHDDHRQRGQSLEVFTDPLNRVRNRAIAVGQTNFEAGANRLTEVGSNAFGAIPAGPTETDRQPSNRANLIATWNLGGYTLTSQSSYTVWNANYSSDLDWTSANLYLINDIQRNKAVSEELRIASPQENTFRFLAGYFYYYNRWGFVRDIRANNTGLTAALFSLNGRATNFFEYRTRANSVFGSASYDLAKTVTVTGGLRYTWEDKTANVSRTSSGSAAPAGVIPYTTFARNEGNLDGDANIKFSPTKGVLLYASYASGSKSGGFQEFPTTAGTAEYKGERSRTIELGTKLSANWANLNVALFRTRVAGFQTSYATAIGGLVQAIVDNANVESKGFEATARVRPVAGLTFGGSVVYADAHFIDDFPTGATGVALIAAAGDSLTRAPKWSGKVEATYETALSNRIDFSLDGNVQFSSRNYLILKDALTGDAPSAPPHQDYALRLSVKDKQTGLEVSVLGNNLTNNQYPVFIGNVTGASGATVPFGQRGYYGALNRPRTISLQITWRR